MSAPAWLAVYRAELVEAAALYAIPSARLAALVEQESNGGIHPKTREHDPRQLYRYEPAFWDRYLAQRADYAPPLSVFPAVFADRALELWKRRVSASYGLCQIMYATARDHGLPPEWPPEALLQPRVNLTLAAKILRHHQRKTAGDWRATWLRYNGGAREAYADEIEARMPRFEALLVEHPS
jgi:hypothetical protein